MIISEKIIINGNSFIKKYSDQGFQIRKIGTDEIYDEAIDIENVSYQYEETDIKAYDWEEI